MREPEPTVSEVIQVKKVKSRIQSPALKRGEG